MEPAAQSYASEYYYPDNSALPPHSEPVQPVITNDISTLQGATLGQRNINKLSQPVAALPGLASENKGSNPETAPGNPDFNAAQLHSVKSAPQVNNSDIENKPESQLASNNVKALKVNYPVPGILDPARDSDKENECTLSLVIRQSCEVDLLNSKEQEDSWAFLKNVAIPELQRLITISSDESWIAHLADWVNFQDDYGFSPLMNASRHGVLPCILLLISAGATPLRERGSTSLHEVLSEEKHFGGISRYEVLQTLLSALKQKVPDQLIEVVNKKFNPCYGKTIKKRLVEMKEKLDSENTVLHQLMKGNNGIDIEEIITLAELLIESGADPMIQNGKGWNVFEYACSERSQDFYKIFQTIINKIPIDKLDRILLQTARIPACMQIVLKSLIRKRKIDAMDNASAVRPQQAMNDSAIPSPQPSPVQNSNVQIAMNQPLATGGMEGYQVPAGIQTPASPAEAANPSLSEPLNTNPLAPAWPLLISSQGQGMPTVSGSFSGGIGASVVATREPERFSEMVSGHETVTPSVSDDPEFSDLLDEFLKDEPLPVLWGSSHHSFDSGSNVTAVQDCSGISLFGLSEQTNNVSESITSEAGVQSLEYEPEVSPVSRVDKKEADSLLPFTVTNVRKPGKMERTRSVKVAPGVEKSRRRCLSKRSRSGVIDFMIAELNRGDSKRVEGLRWHDPDKRIYIKEQIANVELARRWGVAKNNPGMNYEKFARAIRGRYVPDSSGRVIEHLNCGLDGTSKLDDKSVYYRIHY
ncbi:ETS domain-containing protein [Endozoicomonas sp. SCSIO W0465]|uniref:ETS domain-containing protein n=1 Tax=Endozoicomonas sp. SCSIO W0465 TaxID=2918516 RepID=UPI002075AB57|nr:ETS domain-containing protein [Endozoicomonas sp. SCSIO W0465]USE33842.1 ETS domain-containing protein [Endozoicomonas sp. SCSIO W0465]